MSQQPSVFNLGRKQKRKRLFVGIVAFLLAAALSIYFVFEEYPRGIRFFVLPLFFIAMLGFLQAKERTCVFFAWKRIKNLDAGEIPVTDCQLQESLIIKSQKIMAQALLLAFALSLACYFS